jgi:hypothetical protein
MDGRRKMEDAKRRGELTEDSKKRRSEEARRRRGEEALAGSNGPNSLYSPETWKRPKDFPSSPDMETSEGLSIVYILNRKKIINP